VNGLGLIAAAADALGTRYPNHLATVWPWYAEGFIGVNRPKNAAARDRAGNKSKIVTTAQGHSSWVEYSKASAHHDRTNAEDGTLLHRTFTGPSPDLHRIFTGA
jgi:hypothetical protein